MHLRTRRITDAYDLHDTVFCDGWFYLPLQYPFCLRFLFKSRVLKIMWHELLVIAMHDLDRDGAESEPKSKPVGVLEATGNTRL